MMNLQGQQAKEQQQGGPQTTVAQRQHQPQQSLNNLQDEVGGNCGSQALEQRKTPSTSEQVCGLFLIAMCHLLHCCSTPEVQGMGL
jgi:hypothetical protein